MDLSNFIGKKVRSQKNNIEIIDDDTPLDLVFVRIAQEMSIPISNLIDHYQTLQNNMISTVRALRSMQDGDWRAIDIPVGLQEKLKNISRRSQRPRHFFRKGLRRFFWFCLVFASIPACLFFVEASIMLTSQSPLYSNQQLQSIDDQITGLESYASTQSRALLIVVDGLNVDNVEPGTDWYKTLCESRSCGSELVATRMKVGTPTNNVPNWMSLLTGARADITGHLWDVRPSPTKFSTIYSVAVAANVKVGLSTTAWFSDIVREQLVPLNENSASISAFDETVEDSIGVDDNPIPEEGTALQDEQRKEATLKWIEGRLTVYGQPVDATEHPRLWTTQFTSVEVAGHIYGAESDEYQKAVNEVAGHIDSILKSIEGEGEETDIRVIIASTHGQLPAGGHGGRQEQVSTVPLWMYRRGGTDTDSVKALWNLCWSGMKDCGACPQFHSSNVNYDYDIIDVAPTIAAILNVRMPSQNEGRIIFDLVSDFETDHLKKVYLELVQIMTFNLHNFVVGVQEEATLERYMGQTPLNDFTTVASFEEIRGDGGTVNKRLQEILADNSEAQAHGMPDLVYDIVCQFRDARSQTSKAFIDRNYICNAIVAGVIILTGFAIIQLYTFADPMTGLPCYGESVDIDEVLGPGTGEKRDPPIIMWSIVSVFCYYTMGVAAQRIAWGIYGLTVFDISLLHTRETFNLYWVFLMVPCSLIPFVMQRSFEIYSLRQPVATEYKFMQSFVRLQSSTWEANSSIYLSMVYELYMSFVSLYVLIVTGSSFMFVIPYTMQVRWIGELEWEGRFRVLSYLVMGYPLFILRLLSLYQFQFKGISERAMADLIMLDTVKTIRSRGPESELERKKRRDILTARELHVEISGRADKEEQVDVVTQWQSRLDISRRNQELEKLGLEERVKQLEAEVESSKVKLEATKILQTGLLERIKHSEAVSATVDPDEVYDLVAEINPTFLLDEIGATRARRLALAQRITLLREEMQYRDQEIEKMLKVGPAESYALPRALSAVEDELAQEAYDKQVLTEAFEDFETKIAEERDLFRKYISEAQLYKRTLRRVLKDFKSLAVATRSFLSSEEIHHNNMLAGVQVLQRDLQERGVGVHNPFLVTLKKKQKGWFDGLGGMFGKGNSQKTVNAGVGFGGAEYTGPEPDFHEKAKEDVKTSMAALTAVRKLRKGKKKEEKQPVDEETGLGKMKVPLAGVQMAKTHWNPIAEEKETNAAAPVHALKAAHDIKAARFEKSEFKRKNVKGRSLAAVSAARRMKKGIEGKSKPQGALGTMMKGGKEGGRSVSMVPGARRDITAAAGIGGGTIGGGGALPDINAAPANFDSRRPIGPGSVGGDSASHGDGVQGSVGDGATGPSLPGVDFKAMIDVEGFEGFQGIDSAKNEATGKNNYPCPYCGSKLRGASSLPMHIRSGRCGVGAGAGSENRLGNPALGSEENVAEAIQSIEKGRKGRGDHAYRGGFKREGVTDVGGWLGQNMGKPQREKSDANLAKLTAAAKLHKLQEENLGQEGGKGGSAPATKATV